MVTTTCLRESVLDGAKDVFETMIFMALEEVAGQATEMGDETLLSTITFKGSLEGCLGICCDVTCARTITANMLGTDPEDDISEDDINDAVGEVANMVMGAVKSRIQDTVGNVEISIPSVIQGIKLRTGLGERANELVVSASLEEEHDIRLSLLYRESKD